MCADSDHEGRRTLDDIVGDLVEPGFVIRHHRPPPVREPGSHVNPELLALSPPRSRYVKRWRRHARHCLECANVFRYFGLSLD